MWKELLTYWPAWRDFAPDVGDLCGAMFPGLGTSTEDAATRLRDTRLAQQALGLTALAASTLLDALGIAGSFFAGHSYGELPALAHAGVIARSDLIAVSLARGEAILNAQGDGPFAMLAASLGAEEGEALVRGSDDVWVANINAPREIVLSGSRSGIERLRTALENRDVEHRELNVACAFHTPLMVPAAERFSEHLKGVEFHGGHGVVFGSDARAYTDGDDVRARLTNQITRPVHFARTVDAMYDAGARIFVDVGPGRVLSGLIGQVLAERPHQVVSLDSQGGTLRGFLAGIAQLACLGVAVELGPLLRARGADRGTGVANPARKPWSLNGGGCRPPSDEATTEPAAQRTVEPGSITGDEVDVKNDRSIHGDSADALVSAYLDNMRALASEQHALLLHYLQGPESQRTEPVRRLPTRENALPARPAAPPAAPARPAEVALPVSGTSQLARREAAPAIPVAPRPPSGGDYEQAVRAIVARETGYPEEILGMNTDLEAELGVDSLKRLEITVQAAEWAGVDAGARGTAQQAARGFTTMAAIVDWLKKKSNGAAHP
jgi:acyl transferase domain-containing protein